MGRGELQYLNILQNIRDNGYECEPAERQDTGTRQLNHQTFYHDLREGFPLLTTKQMFTKGIIHELLWMLRGDTNIKYLVDNGVNIWNDDAYKYYIRKCKEQNVTPILQYAFIGVIKGDINLLEDVRDYRWGDMGPIYGKQYRKRRSFVRNGTGTGSIIIDTDQIADLIKNIKHAIDTGYNNRRLIVDAWNPGELEYMALPPCHFAFQVILEPIHPIERLRLYDNQPRHQMASIGKFGETPEELMEDMDEHGFPKYYINLKWHQRSVDTFLGLPFNIAFYGFLTHILGSLTNTIPKDLIGDLTCVHVYNNHWEQVETQLNREVKPLPTFQWSNDAEISFENGEVDIDDFLNGCDIEDFEIKNYNPHPPIKAKMIS